MVILLAALEIIRAVVVGGKTHFSFLKTNIRAEAVVLGSWIEKSAMFSNERS